MENPIIPLADDYNQNENLIKNEEQNNQQNIDINQFFVEGITNKKINKYVIRCSPLLVLALIFILLIISLVLTLIPKMHLVIKVISITLGVVISLLLLIFNILKI